MRHLPVKARDHAVDRPQSSQFLGQLRDAAGDGPLSIKFNVDGYSTRSTGRAASPIPASRAVGSWARWGSLRPGEPRHTVSDGSSAARCIRAAPPPQVPAGRRRQLLPRRGRRRGPEGPSRPRQRSPGGLGRGTHRGQRRAGAGVSRGRRLGHRDRADRLPPCRLVRDHRRGRGPRGGLEAQRRRARAWQPTGRCWSTVGTGGSAPSSRKPPSTSAPMRSSSDSTPVTSASSACTSPSSVGRWRAPA